MIKARAIEGHGIGLRSPHFRELRTTGRAIDWLEITPENFIAPDGPLGGRRARALAECKERWRIVPHGVSLSIGGPDPLDRALLDGVAKLCAELESPWFSDHVCWSSANGVQLNDLFPMPFCEESVTHIAKRVREVRRAVGTGILLENPSYYARMPGPLSEAQFLRAVLEESDCGLLLDVNNVHVNASNHGYDPREFIASLPLERVGYIHLAGHELWGDVLFDSHGAPVCDDVWALYTWVIEQIGPVPTLIERDTRVPRLDVVCDENDAARAITRAATRRRARTSAMGARP